jgi:hypothetical protein
MRRASMPTISYTEDATGFTVTINGQPIDSGRLEDGAYYVGMFPHEIFSSPQEIVDRLTETYGILWTFSEA